MQFYPHKSFCSYTLRYGVEHCEIQFVFHMGYYIATRTYLYLRDTE